MSCNWYRPAYRQRVLDCVPISDPDFRLIMELAVVGIHVHRAPTFSLNTHPPPLRELYLKTSCAVNKLIYDLHQSQLVLILPLSYIQTHFPHSLHFSPLHWTKKSGKVSGRQIFDASDEKSGALNSELASALAEEHYGKIVHPTLVDIVLMILDYQEKMQELFGDLFDPSQIVLFKHDLRRAFMRLNF